MKKVSLGFNCVRCKLPALLQSQWRPNIVVGDSNWDVSQSSVTSGAWTTWNTTFDSYAVRAGQILKLNITSSMSLVIPSITHQSKWILPRWTDALISAFDKLLASRHFRLCLKCFGETVGKLFFRNGVRKGFWDIHDISINGITRSCFILDRKLDALASTTSQTRRAKSCNRSH